MSLPLGILAVLRHFAPAFTQPTWWYAVVLLVGTLLGWDRRTVTAAPRLTGHAHNPHCYVFHHVLNRGRWMPLAVSHRLLRLLRATFLPAEAEVLLVIDEILECRWGPQITKRAHYREPSAGTDDRKCGYGVARLSVATAGPAALLGLVRGHWVIEGGSINGGL